MLGDGEIWRLPPAVWFHPAQAVITRSGNPPPFYGTWRTWRGSLEVWWRP